MFVQYFPNPTKAKKPRKNQPEEKNIYKAIQQYFENGNVVDLLTDTSNEVYKNELDKVLGLKETIEHHLKENVANSELHTFMEFMLHGMACYSLLSKFQLEEGNQFSDITSAMFNYGNDDVDDDLKELFK